MHRIIAIGGSGQMALHFYAQLFLTGSISTPFEALVVDTDELTPSLKSLAEFLRDARMAAGQTAGAQIPKIEYLHVGHEDSGTIEERLAGETIDDSLGFRHPLQAFFSAADRKQSVKEGLYSRPALAAVLSPENLFTKLQHIPYDSRICVVASTIGGTGAGLTLPVISFLKQLPGANHQVCAVFMDRYFQPDPGTRKDQIDVFQSNELLFHHSRRELLEPLHYFVTVKPKELIQRDKNAEKHMRHFPWPSQPAHPYWFAASAIHTVLKETTADANTGNSLGVTPLDPNVCSERLHLALARVTACLKHRVFQQVASDTFVDRVWNRLPEFLRSYADALSLDRAAFARGVQAAFDRSWSPAAAVDYGLKHVFPEWDRRSEASPAGIARCQWEKKPGDVTSESLGDRNSAERRVAALALYTLLARGGSR